VFHQQLYVAFSGVGEPEILYVYVPKNKTLNVIMKRHYNFFISPKIYFFIYGLLILVYVIV
jgi:hypothetical protein